jgi:hypothetical protein
VSSGRMGRFSPTRTKGRPNVRTRPGTEARCARGAGLVAGQKGSDPSRFQEAARMLCSVCPRTPLDLPLEGP